MDQNQLPENQQPNSIEEFSPSSSDTPIIIDEKTSSDFSIPVYSSMVFSQVVSCIAIVGCILIMMMIVSATRMMQNKEKNQGKGAGADIHINSKIGYGTHQIGSFQKDAKKGKLDSNTKKVLDGMNEGPVAKRAARAILYADMEDAASGLEKIEEIEKAAAKEKYELSEYDQKILDSSRRVIASSLDEKGKEKFPGIEPASKEDRQLLKDEMFFAGEIAEVIGQPDSSSKKKLLKQTSLVSLVGVITVTLLAFLAIAFGIFVVLPIFCYYFYSGQIRPQFQSPAVNGFLFLEAFAVWICSFIGLQFVLSFLFGIFNFNPETLTGGLELLLNLSLFYTPMIIGYLWLRMRHWDTKRMHQDLGLRSHGIFKDVFCGLTTYLSGLPIIGIGIALTAILTMIFAGSDQGANSFYTPNQPDHPIQNLVTDKSGFAILTLFLLPAISAPIVEEIVFRGMLYRYLRDATQPGKLASKTMSVIVSSFINGFIFAAIHPQGILAIPVLMSLGMVMCYAREWRDGLVAPMTVHAIHNGTISVALSFLI